MPKFELHAEQPEIDRPGQKFLTNMGRIGRELARDLGVPDKEDIIIRVEVLLADGHPISARGDSLEVSRGSLRLVDGSIAEPATAEPTTEPRPLSPGRELCGIAMRWGVIKPGDKIVNGASRRRADLTAGEEQVAYLSLARRLGEGKFASDELTYPSTLALARQFFLAPLPELVWEEREVPKVTTITDEDRCKYPALVRTIEGLTYPKVNEESAGKLLLQISQRSNVIRNLQQSAAKKLGLWLNNPNKSLVHLAELSDWAHLIYPDFSDEQILGILQRRTTPSKINSERADRNMRDWSAIFIVENTWIKDFAGQFGIAEPVRLEEGSNLPKRVEQPGRPVEPERFRQPERSRLVTFTPHELQLAHMITRREIDGSKAYNSIRDIIKYFVDQRLKKNPNENRAQVYKSVSSNTPTRKSHIAQKIKVGLANPSLMDINIRSFLMNMRGMEEFAEFSDEQIVAYFENF